MGLGSWVTDWAQVPPVYLFSRVQVLSVQSGSDGGQFSVGVVSAGLPQDLVGLWQLG